MPKITVIIPTINIKQSLDRAVQSVLKQSFLDWELYIVNDSLSPIDYEHDDPRIKVIENENKSGANGARNTGIKYASGKYIAFLDDDDEWFSEKLKFQIDLMEENQCVLSFTGKNIFYNSLLQKYSFRSSHPYMLFFYNYVGTTSSVMIVKEALLSIGGFDESLAQLQDYDLFLRLKKIGNFSGIDFPLINYYIESSEMHLSINWINFFRSAYKILLKQNGIGFLFFLIGILFTFLQKIKNAINRWRFS